MCVFVYSAFEERIVIIIVIIIFDFLVSRITWGLGSLEPVLVRALFETLSEADDEEEEEKDDEAEEDDDDDDDDGERCSACWSCGGWRSLLWEGSYLSVLKGFWKFWGSLGLRGGVRGPLCFFCNCCCCCCCCF